MGSMQLTGDKSHAVTTLSASLSLSLSLCLSLCVLLSLLLMHASTRTHKHTSMHTQQQMAWCRGRQQNKMAEYKISKELSYKPRVLHFWTLIHICLPLFRHLVKFCVQFNMPSSKESVHICIESVYINSRSLLVMKFQPLMPSCHVTTSLYI